MSETVKYLYIYNKGHGQAYLRFRLRTHNLEIEKGRWHRKLVNGKMQVTPMDERLCIYHSQNAVESDSLTCMF